MNVKAKEIRTEDLSQIEKKIIAEIDFDYYKSELEKTYRDVIKNVAIKGFRPGKAPRSIVERLYGEAIREEVLHRIEKEFIDEYIKENNLEVVSPIRPEHILSENNLRFEYTFEVKPVIVPSNYRGIEVKGNKVEVTEEEVNNLINQITEKYSNPRPSDREVVEKGDLLKITITSHPEQKMVNRPLYIELNEKKTRQFIIDALVGKRLNEEVEVKVDENSDQKMKLRIDEIKVIERPELNDEFVKKFLQMDSVEALKKDIYNKILERKENEEKAERFESILKEIIVRNPFPVPPSMIEKAIEGYIQDMEQSASRKLSKEERDAVSSSVRDKITYEIQKYLILEAIGKLEGIDVTDDDIEAYFKKISDETGENVIKIKAFYEKNNLLEKLKENLKFDKIQDFIINESKIVIE